MADALLTPLEVAEEMARRETLQSVNELLRGPSSSYALAILMGRRVRRPSLISEATGYLCYVARGLEEIGKTMIPIYLKSLRSSFDLESARTSIEVHLDGVLRRALAKELEHGEITRRDIGPAVAKAESELRQVKEKLYRELQIQSHDLRARRPRPKPPGPTVSVPCPNLSFVKDKKLKSFAVTAAEEACRCFESNCFIAAVVLAGSATEAVLLDLLLQQSPKKLKKTHEELHRERLSDLLNSALKLELLGKSAARLGHLIREHRDLVHPARALRERTTPSRGKAEISLGILRDICEELANEAD